MNAGGWRGRRRLGAEVRSRRASQWHHWSSWRDILRVHACVWASALAFIKCRCMCVLAWHRQSSHYHTHTHTELYALVGTLESTFLSQTANTHTHCVFTERAVSVTWLCVVVVVSCGHDDDDVACIPDIYVYRQVILFILLDDTHLRRVHIKNVLFFFLYILLEIRH